MRRLVCHPEAEVMGLTLNAYVDNLMGDETAPIFAKYGLINLDPHGWYRVESMLNAFNELAENPGVILNLTAIGLKIGQEVPMPPELGEPTIEKVLMAWDATYQYLHRSADVGKIWVEKISDKHYKTFHSVVYPDDMSYGVLYGYGKRFLPPHTSFTVYYDAEIPARDYGGNAPYTIIHIDWK